MIATAAVFYLSLASADPARAPDATAAVSVRESHRLSVTAVGKAFIYREGLPMVGVDVAYQLTDRLALGAQLSTVLMAVDASVYGRYYLLARPRSGLFLDLGMHGLAAIMAGGTWAPSAEVGYEARSTGGFIVSVSAGLLAGPQPACDHCGPGMPAPGWFAVPVASFRVGKAF
jgi:hypothetical protein